MPDEASSKATRKPGEAPGIDLKGRKTYSPDPHRLLPQSPDAEKGVLSSFLIAPREIGGLCAEKQVTKEHFAIPSHALIYETLLGMWDKNEPIDFITLTQLLRDRSHLDSCGGAAFVTELFTFLPTAANAPTLNLVRSKAPACARRFSSSMSSSTGRIRNGASTSPCTSAWKANVSLGQGEKPKVSSRTTTRR